MAFGRAADVLRGRRRGAFTWSTPNDGGIESALYDVPVGVGDGRGVCLLRHTAAAGNLGARRHHNEFDVDADLRGSWFNVLGSGSRFLVPVPGSPDRTQNQNLEPRTQ